ncbi:MAG: ferritin-like domain-containing protein [Candidatus Omnitrophica bacterium]|nr:ferritin-like domain-containing protein [Candidatus Omnitrophota bacterium]
MKNKKNISISLLSEIADAEHLAVNCFGHLSRLIKNGKIKVIFEEFEQKSEQNKQLILKTLIANGVNDFCNETPCKFCKINAESFSLFGATQVGLEIVGILINLYKKALNFAETETEKQVFQEILKDKIKQHSTLKKENMIIKTRENSLKNLGIFGTHCISNVMNRFK